MRREIEQTIESNIRQLMFYRKTAIEEGSDIYEVDKFIQEQSKKYMDRYHQMPLNLVSLEVLAKAIADLPSFQK